MMVGMSSFLDAVDQFRRRKFLNSNHRKEDIVWQYFYVQPNGWSETFIELRSFGLKQLNER